MPQGNRKLLLRAHRLWSEKNWGSLLGVLMQSVFNYWELRFFICKLKGISMVRVQ